MKRYRAGASPASTFGDSSVGLALNEKKLRRHPPATHLVAGVIWMAGENRQSAVYLLSQNDAGELMRQSHPPEGPKEIRPFTCRRRPPIRRSNGEHQTLNSLVAESAKMRGEFFRR